MCDTSGHQESDIPGYYYDQEKKRYFKILPNSFSSVSSFVTRENIRKKETEIKRLSDLSKPKSEASKTQTLQKKKSNELGILNILKSVQLGGYSIEKLKTYTTQQMCSELKPDKSWQISYPHQSLLRFDEVQKMEVTSSRDKLLCVSSVKSCIGQCIQLMSVSEEKSHGRKLHRLSIKFNKFVLGPVYKKINCLCMAQMNGQNTALYTSVCPVGSMNSLIFMCNLEAASSNSPPIFEFNLGSKTVWSTAWDSQNSRFSVGLERKCHVIDVTTRKKWTFNTHNSDPLSQTFSAKACNILFNGTRAGCIIVQDVRCPSQTQSTMKQHYGVGCLKLYQNDNYILASDFSGTIFNWDLRKQQVIFQYRGLTNSHYQLPFHLDETETVMCCSGSDSYTKIWSLKTGQLLNSIPPPYPTAVLQNLPVSIYSQHWGNIPGNSGLILAMKDSLFTYTYPNCSD